MVLGRLVHYGVDAILLSTVLAGVRRSSGFGVSPHDMGIPEGAAQGFAESYLAVGETVFNSIHAYAYGSPWFRKKPL